jgi:hypothetical protein
MSLPTDRTMMDESVGSNEETAANAKAADEGKPR